jgi:hypothetical protein
MRRRFREFHRMSTASLEEPAADAEMFTAPPPAGAGKIASFKTALEHALRLEGMQAAAHGTNEAVSALRAQIEACEDERRVGKLMSQLHEAETAAKVQSIRAKKLTADLAAAWAEAAALVTHAVGECADLIGDACAGCYDSFREIAIACLSPEALQLADSAGSVAFRFNQALDSLAGGALATGPANQLQETLLIASRRDHYSTTRQHCENANAAMDAAMAKIPEIQRQAAKLAQIHQTITH